MTTFEKSDSTDTIALVLELVFGIFGILGTGWLYAGNVAVGLALLFGFFILLIGEAIGVALTAGLVACFLIPVNICIAVVSAFKARDHVRNTSARGHLLYAVLGLALPLIVACGSIAFLTLSAPAIDSVFNEIIRGLEMTPSP